MALPIYPLPAQVSSKDAKLGAADGLAMSVDWGRPEVASGRQTDAMTQSGRRHLGLLSLNHRNVFSYPDHTRFRPKQGRKAAVQCSDPGNAHQKNDAGNADDHLGDDAAFNLH